MNMQEPEQQMLLRLFRLQDEDEQHEDQGIVRIAIREN